jgi:hypothetical protein
MTAKAITRGKIPILKNLATRMDMLEDAAPATSLTLKKKIRLITAAILTAAVSPMAATVVTVVTVVVVIVVTMSAFSFDVLPFL